MNNKPLIAALCSFAMFFSSCASVQLSDRTRTFLALQFAESQLAQGLAAHLKVLPETTVAPQELAKAANKFDRAAVANNAVIEDLLLTLSQTGTTSPEVNQTLAKAAIAALLEFRTVAESLASLGDTSPLESKALLETMKRGDPAVIALAVAGAKEAVAWWYAQNQASRQEMKEHVERYRLELWTAIPAAR